MALGAGMLVGPMVASAMAQTVPTISSTTTTERPPTTTRSTTTTSEATTTSTAAPTTTDRTSTTSTTPSTTSTTAAGGATTSSVEDSSTTTVPEGEIDPITNRQLVPTTTVPVGLDVGNPARISPIFPWLSVLGFLAAIGIVGAQYFLTGRRS